MAFEIWVFLQIGTQTVIGFSVSYWQAKRSFDFRPLVIIKQTAAKLIDCLLRLLAWHLLKDSLSYFFAGPLGIQNDAGHLSHQQEHFYLAGMDSQLLGEGLHINVVMSFIHSTLRSASRTERMESIGCAQRRKRFYTFREDEKVKAAMCRGFMGSARLCPAATAELNV